MQTFKTKFNTKKETKNSSDNIIGKGQAQAKSNRVRTILIAKSYYLSKFRVNTLYFHLYL